MLSPHSTMTSSRKAFLFDRLNPTLHGYDGLANDENNGEKDDGSLSKHLEQVKRMNSRFRSKVDRRPAQNWNSQNYTRFSPEIPSNLVVKMQGNKTKYYKKHIVYQDLPQPIPSKIRYYHWDDDSIGM